MDSTLNLVIDWGVLAHSGLNADLLDVLPALWKLRREEVESLDDVSSDLLGGLVLLGDGGVGPCDTLNSEPSSVVHLLDLLLDAASFSDQDRKSLDGGERLSDGLVQVSVESGRDEDHVVTSGPLLDLLHVVVELLEVIHIDVIDLVSQALVLVSVVDDADNLKVLLDQVWQINISGQLLLLLGIVVSEDDLEFDGLGELSWLVLLNRLHLFDVGKELVLSNFAGVIICLPHPL